MLSFIEDVGGWGEGGGGGQRAKTKLPISKLKFTLIKTRAVDVWMRGGRGGHAATIIRFNAPSPNHHLIPMNFP